MRKISEVEVEVGVGGWKGSFGGVGRCSIRLDAWGARWRVESGDQARNLSWVLA